MADKLDRSISDELKRIAGVGANDRFPVMSGKVKSIDEGESTCIVALTVNGDDDKTEGVLLNAVSMNSNGFILYPANNSQVWVAEIDGPGKWGLIKCSDLKKVKVTVGSAVLIMADGKFTIKNGNTSLGKILSHILQHLEALTVTTGTGPSGPPINLNDFLQDGIDDETLLE